MTRITVNVNDDWLDAARDVLGTDTKVATINAALHAFALRKQAAEIVAAFDAVPVDLDDGGPLVGVRVRSRPLHYDADYDRIAAVTGQPTEWAATKGTL